MTSATPSSTFGPSIRIVLSRGAPPKIEHRRPQAFHALIGRPAQEALAAVPLLLPVCGEAQRVAAARAVENACARPADAERERWREIGLVAEQAASLAWRLAVDWPALVRAPADLPCVKAIRQRVRPIADAARAVERDISPPPAAAALDAAVDAAADLLDNLAAAASGADLDAMLQTLPDDHAVVAEILRRAAAAPTELGVHDGQRLGALDIMRVAAPALTDADFDIAAPSARPIEIGPFATPGDAVVAEAENRFGAGAFARLLAGARAALKWRDVARRTVHDERRPTMTSSDAYVGIGAAMTARGPVLHRIAVDGPMDAPTIATWRAVAPTDWHFATNGPIARTFRPVSSFDLKQSEAALCVAGFDPCAPCIVETGDDA